MSMKLPVAALGILLGAGQLTAAPLKVYLMAGQQTAIDAFRKTVYNPEEMRLMDIGVSNAAYHYLGCAKIMARMGKAFADAMAGMTP
jgi:hypothetical protein